MCFELDSRPPIAPISGGALDSARITLGSSDGTAFAAFRARASEATGAGMIVLPDVRGLHPYYEELALRFAEHGVDALAIDYFGRTAGTGQRGEDFDHVPHVGQTTFDGLAADVRAGAAYLRSGEGGAVTSLFTVGFCFGGRLSFDCSTIELGTAGVIGFYGWPTGPGRNDLPAPADVAPQMSGAVLGVFGGADQGIPASAVALFERALADAGVPHTVTTYPGAPHSFFDRKAEEFAAQSADAWAQVLDFVAANRMG
jgi:carboxymethylenebutenolidase